MSIFELWFLFVVLPSIEALASYIVVILGFFFLILGVIFIATEGDAWEGTKVFLIKFRSILVGLLLFGLLGGFAPNEKQIALIIGGAVATNTEGVEKLPANLVNAANSFLERVQKEGEKQ